MKRIFFIFAILFFTVASYATVEQGSCFVDRSRMLKPQAEKITIKVVIKEGQEAENLDELIKEIGAIKFLNPTECTISITLEASVGFAKVSGTASATAPTCKEAAEVAAKGAKDALEAAKKVLM